jgi:hypothetical protein
MWVLIPLSSKQASKRELVFKDGLWVDTNPKKVEEPVASPKKVAAVEPTRSARRGKLRVVKKCYNVVKRRCYKIKYRSSKKMYKLSD